MVVMSDFRHEKAAQLLTEAGGSFEIKNNRPREGGGSYAKSKQVFDPSSIGSVTFFYI
jgi:hypothetical protein